MKSPEFVKVAGKWIIKNASTILTALGSIGVIETVRVTYVSGPQIRESLEDAKAEKNGEELTVFETVKAAAPVGWKVVAAAGGTLLCFISANSINLRRNAALLTVYQLSQTALKEYQDKVVETIGEKEDRKIKDQIAKDHVEKNPITANKVIMTGDGEHLCYDVLSGRYFKSDIEKIRRTVNELNATLLREGWVSLNDLYDKLDLDGIKRGEDLGWWLENQSDLIEIDFSSQLAKDGTPCLVLDYITEPRYTG
jgi:hypothetical protein